MLSKDTYILYRDRVAKFCAAVEDGSESRSDSLLTVRNALVDLYATFLQWTELPDANFPDLPTRFTHEQWATMEKKIERYTRKNFFWFCYEPFTSPPEEPVCSSLSDALADIWRDLKPGLLLLQEDEEKWADSVFWEWKFSFDTHWGDHAVDSIWAIHKLLN